MKGLHLVLRWRLWDTEIKTDFTTTFTWVKSIITGEKKSVSKTKHRNARQSSIWRLYIWLWNIQPSYIKNIRQIFYRRFSRQSKNDLNMLNWIHTRTLNSNHESHLILGLAILQNEQTQDSILHKMHCYGTNKYQ